MCLIDSIPLLLPSVFLFFPPTCAIALAPFLGGQPRENERKGSGTGVLREIPGEPARREEAPGEKGYNQFIRLIIWLVPIRRGFAFLYDDTCTPQTGGTRASERYLTFCVGKTSFNDWMMKLIDYSSRMPVNVNAVQTPGGDFRSWCYVSRNYMRHFLQKVLRLSRAASPHPNLWLWMEDSYTKRMI